MKEKIVKILLKNCMIAINTEIYLDFYAFFSRIKKDRMLYLSFLSYTCFFENRHKPENLFILSFDDVSEAATSATVPQPNNTKSTSRLCRT